MTNPKELAFTRYLYEKTEVMHSLLFALLEHNREEALFWTYELYYSGFEHELAVWVQWIYDTFYSLTEPHYSDHVAINLSRLSTLPIPEERDCLFGTIISNLAHREFDIQQFVSRYMGLIFDAIPISPKNHRIYIRFRPRDLAKYKTKHIVARQMLEHVSDYPVRKSEALFMQKYVDAYSPHTPNIETANFSDSADTVEPYLHHWLYYACKSPIWAYRISDFQTVIDDATKTVRFVLDDECEMFYDDYGYEPDEQSEKMHILHGVDVYRRGVFENVCPHTFITYFSQFQIVKYRESETLLR